MIKVTNVSVETIGNPCYAKERTFYNQAGQHPHQCNFSGKAVCDRSMCVGALIIDHLTQTPGRKLGKDTIESMAQQIAIGVPKGCRRLVNGEKVADVTNEQGMIRRIRRTLGEMCDFLATQEKHTSHH